MRILVSSCLLGEDTRYDGLNSSIALNPKFRFAQKELFMILCVKMRFFQSVQKLPVV